jgi:hypothetical protein
MKTKCYTFDKVIETIEESSYHIPQEFFVDMASGIPSAYVEGITNGKKQAIEILKQFQQEHLTENPIAYEA